MLIYLLLFIIIICAGMYYYSTSGSAELVENKIKHVNNKKMLGYKNFTSFLDKKELNNHLVCVIGTRFSGRTYFSKLLAAKYKYQIISQDGNVSAPAIRKEFFIDNNKNPADIEKLTKKKYIIEGMFDDTELKRIFKGKNYNRNFLLIFIQPKEGCAFKWHKITGKPKEDYDTMLKESNKLLAQITKYRVYILQNDFTD